MQQAKEKTKEIANELVRSHTDNPNTNVYHISYAPATKEASLFFWGCNFSCRGCLCKKEIHNFLLKENLYLPFEEPKGLAKPPDRFLDLKEVIRTLDELDVRLVLLEGQEASLDPSYPALTEALHKRLGSRNILCSNIYKTPSLKDTDAVAVSIKAFTDRLHQHYTGKSNKRVLDNFVSLYKSGIKLSVASVFIPDYINNNEIELIARFIACVDKDIPFQILPYFKAGDNPWRHPIPEEMDEAARVARKHLNKVYSWNGNEKMDYEVVKIL